MNKEFLAWGLILTCLLASGCGKVAQVTSDDLNNSLSPESSSEVTTNSLNLQKKFSVNLPVDLKESLSQEVFSGKLKVGTIKTVKVPQDYPTIQTAIDAVNPNNITIIYISKGTYSYSEPVKIVGTAENYKKNIWLVGEEKENTILNADIYLEYSEGIKVHSLTINQVDIGNYIAIGGYNNNSLAINNCIISGEVGLSEGEGLIIKNNRISHTDTGVRVMIAYYKNALIKYNVIYNATYGIAMISNSNISAVIQHNTIDSCTYGIYSRESSAIEIEDNIVTNGFSGIESNNSSQITVTYNDSWNNTSSNYKNAPTSSTNISENPLYDSQAAHKYNLQTGSPCIGAASDGTNIGAL